MTPNNLIQALFQCRGVQFAGDAPGAADIVCRVAGFELL